MDYTCWISSRPISASGLPENSWPSSPPRRFLSSRPDSTEIGAKYFAGRFVPGTLTNPRLADYIEPQLLLVTDPAADQQAVREALNVGIPIIGLCDANNETKNMDVIIPSNNKGRRALATVYWLLTREYMKNKGLIKTDEEFGMEIDEFEATL
jgi:small subunit ribosomal protein S2